LRERVTACEYTAGAVGICRDTSNQRTGRDRDSRAHSIPNAHTDADRRGRVRGR